MTRCAHTLEILRDAAGNPNLIECPSCGAWWNVEPNPQTMAKGPCASCGGVCDPGESLCVDCLADEAEAASTTNLHGVGTGDGRDGSGAATWPLPPTSIGAERG